MATLGEYIKQLQEVDKQPDQSCVACEPVKSSFEHICPNNPILTCNCTDPKFCAELGSDPDGNTVDGNKLCPDSGKLCNERSCPNECFGDKDGFSDNIDYTGIPIPTPKRESKKLGWPCVVVGAVCETWVTTTERILRTTAGEWDTKQHTDAGLDNDGPAATTGL